MGESMAGSTGNTFVDESYQEMPLFWGLDEAEVREILSISQAVRFRAGEVIIREEESGDAFYLLEEGVVEVSRRSGDGDEIIARLEAKTFVGEMELVSDEPRVATVVAKTDVQAGAVTHADFKQLLIGGGTAGPKMIVNIAKVLCQRLRLLDEHFVHLAATLAGKQTEEVLSELNSFRRDLLTKWQF